MGDSCATIPSSRISVSRAVRCWHLTCSHNFYIFMGGGTLSSARAWDWRVCCVQHWHRHLWWCWAFDFRCKQRFSSTKRCRVGSSSLYNGDWCAIVVCNGGWACNGKKWYDEAHPHPRIPVLILQKTYRIRYALHGHSVDLSRSASCLAPNIQ